MNLTKAALGTRTYVAIAANPATIEQSVSKSKKTGLIFKTSKYPPTVAPTVGIGHEVIQSIGVIGIGIVKKPASGSLTLRSRKQPLFSVPPLSVAFAALQIIIAVTAI